MNTTIILDFECTINMCNILSGNGVIRSAWCLYNLFSLHVWRCQGNIVACSLHIDPMRFENIFGVRGLWRSDDLDCICHPFNLIIMFTLSGGILLPWFFGYLWFSFPKYLR